MSTPFGSSTCFGCRGKRSADADADAYYGVYGYGVPHYGYGRYYGFPGVAGHPGFATSFEARSPQGIGKRSADAEADADAEAHYGYYGYGYNRAYGYGYPRAYGYGYGYPRYGYGW